MTMEMTTTISLGQASGTLLPTLSSALSDVMAMDMPMMNSYFVTDWLNYPVIFRTMALSNGGKLFGIFLFLFVLGFLFRGLSFASAYIEQKVFHNYQNSVIVEVEENCECGDVDTDSAGKSAQSAPTSHKMRSSKLRQFLLPGKSEFLKDVVRLLLLFLTLMIGYLLMIAAMSYVILYFFAVVLGIAFGEVFFNRLAIVLDVNKNNSLCSTLH